MILQVSLTDRHHNGATIDADIGVIYNPNQL